MNRTVLAIIMILSLSMLITILPGPANAAPKGLFWSPKAPIPVGTGQASVVTGPDGRVYLFGGLNTTNFSTPQNNARAYNPATDSWTALAPLPTATRGSVAALGKNGLIYVMGGFNGGFLNLNQAYNITSNTWTSKTAMLTGVWEASAATGDNGIIYVIGGENGPNMVQRYNPTTDTWSAGASLPVPRIHLKAIKATNGLIYAIGGLNGSSFVVVANVEAYDPAGNSWSEASPMPQAKSSFGATLGPDGLIYVFGGSNNDGNDASPYYGSIQAYDSISNQWFTVGDLTVARRELSAATVGNAMYVMGGGNGTYVSNNDAATVVATSPPTATIISITATPVAQGTSIAFNGTGNSSTGTIVAYKWRSSISGTISTAASFSTSTLPVGTHTIYFSVQDNSGLWSPETTAVVTVSPSINSDPVYQSVQTTMLILYATLAAAIAAVVISIYSLMSRKKTNTTP